MLAKVVIKMASFERQTAVRSPPCNALLAQPSHLGTALILPARNVWLGHSPLCSLQRFESVMNL